MRQTPRRMMPSTDVGCACGQPENQDVSGANCLKTLRWPLACAASWGACCAYGTRAAVVLDGCCTGAVHCNALYREFKKAVAERCAAICKGAVAVASLTCAYASVSVTPQDPPSINHWCTPRALRSCSKSLTKSAVVFPAKQPYGVDRPQPRWSTKMIR
jgi:hypothetical protein